MRIEVRTSIEDTPRITRYYRIGIVHVHMGDKWYRCVNVPEDMMKLTPDQWWFDNVLAMVVLEA